MSETTLEEFVETNCAECVCKYLTAYTTGLMTGRDIILAADKEAQAGGVPFPDSESFGEMVFFAVLEQVTSEE